MMEQRQMLVEWWPVDRPIDYSGNPRRIPQSAVDKVAASIREFGWRQPIVVDSEGVIVIGHTRRRAARKLGMDEVPVHVAGDLKPEQARALRLADNRTGEESGWSDILPAELADLKDLGIDMGLTGFDLSEVDELLDSAPPFDAPEEILENIEDMERIKKTRRAANKKTQEKQDTEKYLVIVFPTRAAKIKLLTVLGLPADERYITASSVRITKRGPDNEAGKIGRAAPPAHSGAGG